MEKIHPSGEIQLDCGSALCLLAALGLHGCLGCVCSGGAHGWDVSGAGGQVLEWGGRGEAAIAGAWVDQGSKALSEGLCLDVSSNISCSIKCSSSLPPFQCLGQ